MPVIATGCVPAVLPANVPVAAPTCSASPASLPAKAAFAVTRVAAVLPSYGLSFAVMPETAVIGAGEMLAVVVAAASASV